MSHKWMFLYLAVVTPGALAGSGSSDSEKLYAAIRSGDLPQLSALLGAGIEATASDDRKITPLMYAAEVGSVAQMEILTEKGAEVNAQNSFGSTALMWSVSDIRKVQVLLAHHADVNLAAKSGKTALLIALSNHSPEAARLLIARGADTAAIDKKGQTALLAAVDGNDFETIRALVEAGANVNQPGPHGLTPLMGAAGNRNLAAVKLLLAKGAKVNAVSLVETQKVNNRPLVSGGLTPLLMAATYGPPDLVRALLDAGAKVNAAEARGMTPLMLALTTDRLNPEIVKLLLERGADPRMKSIEGETALDWAEKYRVASIISELGGKPEAPATPNPASEPNADVGLAVARSLGLLEKTSAQFFKEAGCFSCHAQTAAHMAGGAMSARGFRGDQQAANDRQKQMTAPVIGAGPQLMEGLGGDAVLYILEALARTGYASDRVTDFLAAAVAAEQSTDGRWDDGSAPARTPLQDGDFSRTAMAVRALRIYGAPARAGETKERIERAKQWLLRSAPVITEDWDMRLMGVAAAGASGTELRKLAAPIVALQRPDGGWAQRYGFPSDAYATGMTLSALAESGIVQQGVIDNLGGVYQRGAQFLLKTQAQDGSWHVLSRAAKIQPYFESGFPYGGDQWISSMATGWAVNALVLGLNQRR